jgi:hypothetical protein
VTHRATAPPTTSAGYLRGHDGLDLDDIKRAGQALLQRLREGFEHATVRDRSCRLINWHYHGLKVIITMGRPELVRAECTPNPGNLLGPATPSKP